MHRDRGGPVDRRARPPNGGRLRMTRPRGNGTIDPVLLRERLERLERVLGR